MSARVLVTAALVAALSAACAPETIVVVLPAEGTTADAGNPQGTADASATGPADVHADAATPGDDAASYTWVDSGIPSADAAMPTDASSMDAVAPIVDASTRPSPGVFGCPDAPFYADGAVCLVDDPCTPEPSGRYLASGSLQCMPDGDAEWITCAADSPYRKWSAPVPATQLLRITSFAPFPFRLRTPQVTAPHVACAPDCSGTPSVASGVLRFAVALPFAEALTVHVGAPWKVAVDLPSPFCVDASAVGTSGCLRATVQNATITVYTTDPYAPSRDVLVDVAARTSCP